MTFTDSMAYDCTAAERATCITSVHDFACTRTPRGRYAPYSFTSNGVRRIVHQWQRAKSAARYESGTLAAFCGGVIGIVLIALGVVSLLAVVGGLWARFHHGQARHAGPGRRPVPGRERAADLGRGAGRLFLGQIACPNALSCSLRCCCCASGHHRSGQPCGTGHLAGLSGQVQQPGRAPRWTRRGTGT